MASKRTCQDGFTFPELLIASLILMAIFVGTMMVFIKCLDLTEFAGNSTSAVWAVKNRIAQIEGTAFAQIAGTYHNVTFTDNAVNGIGVSDVDSSNPELLEVTVTFCWRQKNGRIIGEDLDLDGVLDGGEDTNGNGIIDSPVQVVTKIYEG